MANSDTLYNEMLVDLADLWDGLGTSFSVREKVFNETTRVTEYQNARTVVGLISNRQAATGLSFLTGDNFNLSENDQLLLEGGAGLTEDTQVQINNRWMPVGDFEIVKPADILVMYIVEVAL